MVNYAFGILIVVIILILAVTHGKGSYLLIGLLASVCAAAVVAMKEVQPTKDGSAETRNTTGSPVSGVKFQMRDILRNAKSGIKSIASATAIGATAGWGGDTIVEVIGIVLDSTLWLGEMASVFLTNVGDYSTTLRRIWDLNFSRGIDGLRSDMAVIVKDAGGPSREIFAQVRRVYESTIEWLIQMLGSAISVCIPDDASLTGWAFSEIGIIAIRGSPAALWWTVSALYEKLPQFARDTLQNPGGLEKVAVDAIKMLEQYVLNGGDDKWWQTIAKSLGRNTVITSVAVGTALLQPILLMPVAITIFLGGQLLNAFYTVGLGNQQISAVLHTLYEKKLNIVGVGQLTAVEAMVMFMRKITVLTFAGLYIMSDNSIDAATGPPSGFVPPGLDDLKARAKTVVTRPDSVKGVSDVLATTLDTVANQTPPGNKTAPSSP